MARVAGLVLASLLMFSVFLGGCLSLLGGGGSTTTADQTAGSSGAAGGGPAVPPTWESLDRQAADQCPGLPWSVLAAIGRVESDSGRSTAPGVASGANSAGAEGPMQFEPATFLLGTPTLCWSTRSNATCSPELGSSVSRVQ